MNEFKLNILEYGCVKEESNALPDKTYQTGVSEIGFSSILDNNFDTFMVSFATNSTLYRCTKIGADRKTWRIEPALRDQINTTTVVQKYLPLKAENPGELPALAQVHNIVNNTILEQNTTNATYKTFIYKTTFRKNIEFVIPESRYLTGIKVYGKFTQNDTEYYELDMEVKYDKIDIGQRVTFNQATQVYEMLFVFTTTSLTNAIQPT